MKNLDDNFAELMKNQKQAKPSPRFSINVMEKIYALNQKVVYTPVIGKWGWRIILSLSAVFFAYLFFATGSGTEGQSANWLAKIAAYLPSSMQSQVLSPLPVDRVAGDVTGFFDKFPTVLLIALIALAALLLIDRWVMKKKEQV